MGVVVAFGGPALRARRRQFDGFCEVTIFPGRLVDARDALLVADGRHKGGEVAADKPPEPRKKRTK
jgi:hypothetical protein